MTLDVDNQNIKYNKRVKRRIRRRNIRGTVMFLGGSLLGGAILGASLHYILNRIFFPPGLDLAERRRRADQHFRERNADTKHFNLPSETSRLEREFDKIRQPPVDSDKLQAVLDAWQKAMDLDIMRNIPCINNWIRSYLLPTKSELKLTNMRHRTINMGPKSHKAESRFFKSERKGQRMQWEDEWDALPTSHQVRGPVVDYTNPSKYAYPSVKEASETDEDYPQLQILQQIMNRWPQDQDYIGAIHETLLHFNYSDPIERAKAERFRDLELPFKLYDIPEITAAAEKWTDDYLSDEFGDHDPYSKHPPAHKAPKQASGLAQESPNNFFAFFVPKLWEVKKLGLPPTRLNDWSYREWVRHARYADAVSLEAHKPHFYFQAGTSPGERFNEDQSFITRDLPSFGAKTEANFFLFHPEEQKGIQCRFGERGVVAATHFDGGRNMVAMMKGAKRYILSPPNQCSKLGIFTDRKSPIFRHSLLNFGHLNEMNDTNMSLEEREWLEKAATALSVETVLKRGEVLYIPSHWFHYIISVQQSAQCNVRSGIVIEGNPRFGGRQDVDICSDNPNAKMDILVGLEEDKY
ncbi:hypothetical protein FisN_15Hh010 [Fistulifera solaris]|uniref:JmjC domain-containing protein n=1 Tax=Fistulifera solaris TaxID=1519565 RepID=A0A1Z5K9Z8_FISSO|nr:hypothetical protein FisN_15Hh010 [Fistulifera solaris]|eukprot:GAX23087.1 hypothetical protein FisN_15Hh010 [Fistulifera solaris]